MFRGMDTDETRFPDWISELIEAGPQGMARFAATLDLRWIDAALEATGTASVRRRKLPAEQAVWLVIGMALFADRSIQAVVEHLSLVMPKAKSLSPSAIPQARYRLGAEPLRLLFEKVANTWSGEFADAYKGYSLHAVDGTCLRVQDSDANFEVFGKPGGRSGGNDAGYPQVRLVTLLNVGSRMVEAASFGAYRESEISLTGSLWSALPDMSLTILDRGFSGFQLWTELVDVDRQRHLLVRLRKTAKYTEVEELQDGSILVDMVPSQAAIRAGFTDMLRGRLVAYEHTGHEPVYLFTSLTDWETHPAGELVALYHERWEIELSYDELKTHMLERKECLRSLKPEGVKQEIWGLLLTYNLVRREMAFAADAHKVEPKQISFTSALLWIRTIWLQSWGGTPGTIPRHLGNLRTQLKLLVLPPRRSKRRYPRHVKIKMSNFKRNRGKRSGA